MQYFVVDAFTDRPLAGNPAAVLVLDAWPEADWMQALAAEFNLSETAFVVPQGQGHGLRWFTPGVEVDLCGHATLAAAHVLLHEQQTGAAAIDFHTRSGLLRVEPDGDGYAMRFPAIAMAPVTDTSEQQRIAAMLGEQPDELLIGPNYLAVFGSQTQVAALKPDFSALATLAEGRGVIATAPGDAHNFVSRYFVPSCGINEDPVTGSAHCALAPYWANRLGRDTLRARQISARGGELACRVVSDAVVLAGQAVTVMRGQLAAPVYSKRD